MNLKVQKSISSDGQTGFFGKETRELSNLFDLDKFHAILSRGNFQIYNKENKKQTSKQHKM